jgi:uncharacterized membrane protein
MKSKTSAAMVLVCVFLMGGIAGAVTFYLLRNHVIAAGPRGGPPPGPRDIVEQMAKDLKLEGDQKDRLRAILTQGRERLKALSQQYDPQYQAIRDETRRSIRLILHDDQKAQFEKIVREIDQRHKTRGGRGAQ